MRILITSRGCSWYDEYLGTTVREQVNHGILARHRMMNRFRHTMSGYKDLGT